MAATRSVRLEQRVLRGKPSAVNGTCPDSGIPGKAWIRVIKGLYWDSGKENGNYYRV